VVADAVEAGEVDAGEVAADEVEADEELLWVEPVCGGAVAMRTGATGRVSEVMT